MESSVEEKILEMQELKRRSHEEAVQRNAMQADAQQQLQQQGHGMPMDTSADGGSGGLAHHQNGGIPMQMQIPEDMQREVFRCQLALREVAAKITQIKALLDDDNKRKRQKKGPAAHPKKPNKASSSGSTSSSSSSSSCTCTCCATLMSYVVFSASDI